MTFYSQLLLRLYQSFKSKKFVFDQIELQIKISSKKLSDTLRYLVKQGYLSKNQTTNKLLLTSKGWAKALEILLLSKGCNKTWDHKWRIVIFDIPETKRKFRSHIRKTLYHLNFIKLQKSVWITPYDVFDDLIKLLPSAKKGDWIKMMIVESISNEDDLKSEFKLTS